jgi:hypothetical protein
MRRPSGAPFSEPQGRRRPNEILARLIQEWSADSPVRAMIEAKLFRSRGQAVRAPSMSVLESAPEILGGSEIGT